MHESIFKNRKGNFIPLKITKLFFRAVYAKCPDYKEEQLFQSMAAKYATARDVTQSIFVETNAMKSKTTCRKREN